MLIINGEHEKKEPRYAEIVSSLPTGSKKFLYIGMRKITGETGLVDRMNTSIMEKLSLGNLMYFQMEMMKEYTVRSEERCLGKKKLKYYAYR